MSPFSSNPVIPPEPSGTVYPASDLDLFHEFGSRGEYQTVTGAQAPPWDPTRPMQGWRDDSATADPTSYSVAVKLNGKSQGQTITVPLSQAKSVNLPGQFEWPAYSYSPGSVTILENSLNGQIHIPISQVGAVLCMEADANAIAAEISSALSIGASVITDTSYVYEYGSDPRQAWKVVFSNGLVTMAGVLIAAKAVQGVGAPGYWSIGQNESVLWNPTQDPGIAALSDPGTVAGKRPCPIRALYPDESFGGQLADTPFTIGTPMITRAGTTPAPGPANPFASLTPQQIAILEQIAHNFGWL